MLDALALAQQPQSSQQQQLQQQSSQQQAQLQPGLILEGGVEPAHPNSGAGPHVADAVEGAQLLLQQMLLAGGDVDGASGSGAQHGQGDLGIGLDLASHQQQQPSVMQQLASLPTQALVQQSTDPLQLSGLINFTFSQSPNSSFVLNTQLDSSGSTPVATLTQALRVVLAARKINTQAVARFDLGFVPFLVSDAAEGIGLLVYKCSLQQDGSRGSVLKIDSSSNPLVAGISLFNMLQSGGQMLEVIFTADASKVALQALSIMRINLANNGRDVLLLLSTVDYTADASGPKNYFLLKLTPITPPLPCFQHQIEANKAASAAAGSYMAPEATGMQGMGMGGLARPMQMQMHGGPGMGPPVLSPALGPVPGVGGLGMKAGGLGVGAGPMQQYLPIGGGGGGMGMGMAGAAGGGSSAKQQRARKADYVIVTEDTAIKNAAGAIAKVLGRVSNQGQCCPVYTEKKTESFTTVISVAVKAIAVARGYVCNEGMGNEVGFQPYLRHLDRRLDLLDLHNFLAPEKQHQHQHQLQQQQQQQMLSAAAAAGLGYGQPHLGMPGLGAAGLLGASGAAAKGHMGLAGAGMQPQMGMGMGGMGAAYGGAAGMLGGGMGGGGMLPAKYTSPMDSFELLDEDALSDERCELAFDVFKVPQLHELQDAGNLPVKVTAHSRPNVVSNIISKLVTERSGAVLITAGGKAMHVAMTAVVSARARLKAKGVDIILLPKFVTVDTTSTLGWESVFLRFTIVRWAPLPPSAAAMGGMPAMHADAMMAAAVAGGRYLLPQLG